MSADEADMSKMPGQGTGRIERALVRWLGREAVVSRVQALAPHFRLIDLEGEALREVAWSVGQKLQVSISGMRVARTYTPLYWDPGRGTTRFLVWLHGDAPGSDWARQLAPGMPCAVIGPRRSLEVAPGEAPLIVVGDETVFGLAHALRLAYPQRPVHAWFEVTPDYMDECWPVLDNLGLDDAGLLPRSPDEHHLHDIERALAAWIQTDAIFVLAGRAPAIQHLQRYLKQGGVASSRLRAKVYWAPGKTGLD